MNRFKSLHSKAYMGVFVLLLSVSLIWVLLNIGQEPAYGDTVEYWQLSKTLYVDTWRTLGYPIILKITGEYLPMAQTRAVIYVLQLACSFVAALYFFNTLNIFSRNKVDRSAVLIMALTLSVMPLMIHFSLSILTDSLANSLFIVGLMAIARIAFLDAPGRYQLHIAALSILGAGLIREDRIIFLVIVLSGVLAWLLLRKAPKERLALVVILLIPVILVMLINSATQTTNPQRPPLSMTGSLFPRFTRSIVSDRFEIMPSIIQERIGSDLAYQWQANEGHTLAVLSALNDKDGHEAMLSAIKKSVVCCSLRVGSTMTLDFIEYVFSPFTYMKESIFTSPDPTQWTNSRMSMYRPLITKIYNWYSFLLLLFLVALAIYGRRFIHIDQRLWVYICILIVFIASAITLRSSLDFHIRYGLTIYTLEIGVLIWCGVSVLLQIRQKSE